MNIAENEERLEKRIGFWGLLSMSVGVNIGGSLFALTTHAAGYSGPSLPIAMVVSAMPVVLALAPFCLLSIVYPTTSASYRYAQLVSPTMAKVYLLTSVTCMGIGGLPLFALVAGRGLEPVLGLPPTTVGLLVLAFFYVVNILGVGLTARLQLLLSLVLMSALVVFVGSGVPHVSVSHLTPLFPNGVHGTLVASGLLFTFCAGGLFVVDVGGEVISAHKNIPRALTLGMILALGLYLCITVVTVGTIHWSELNARSLVDVAETFMSGNTLLFFALGGAVIAAATTINAVLALQARLILVISEEELISPTLGAINLRFGTPHWALTLIYLLSSSALLCIPSVGFFASMLNFVMLLAVTLVALAGLKVARRHPRLCHRSATGLTPASLERICWIVVASNVLIFSFFGIVMKWASLVFAGVLMASYLYSRTRKETLRDIELSTAEIWSSL
jgi:APA family basic amino acid/polyamine antiporter